MKNAHFLFILSRPIATNTHHSHGSHFSMRLLSLFFFSFFSFFSHLHFFKKNRLIYLKYFRDYPLADWSFKKYRRCFPTATKLQAKYLRNLQTVKAHSKNIPQEAREQINSLVNSFNSMDTPVVNNIYGDSYNVNFEKDGQFIIDKMNQKRKREEGEETEEEVTDDEAPQAPKEPETFWNKWTIFLQDAKQDKNLHKYTICPNTSVPNIPKEEYDALLHVVAKNPKSLSSMCTTSALATIESALSGICKKFTIDQ
ncbi:hypothetical protein EDC94DRAFT_303885 [Helicostylum pulchrum]|nr:hypothetical protein EDC94DRAFT_303885 [Helicostylum pulchrum]